MEKLEFKNIPEVIQDIQQNVNQLVEHNKRGKPEEDYFMDIKELINYLPEKPAKQTIYQMTSNRKIPYQKHGRKLLFLKSAIDQWLRNGRMMDLKLR